MYDTEHTPPRQQTWFRLMLIDRADYLMGEGGSLGLCARHPHNNNTRDHNHVITIAAQAVITLTEIVFFYTCYPNHLCDEMTASVHHQSSHGYWHLCWHRHLGAPSLVLTLRGLLGACVAVFASGAPVLAYLSCISISASLTMRCTSTLVTSQLRCGHWT